MELEKGVRLGPYEIDARVGAGGMGEVYRAHDTRLPRPVAVKILPAAFARDARLRLRFEREARAISSLSHPHICTLYDIGQHDDMQYLVMEYCEGPTLAARLLSGRMPADQALRYGVQIADALEKAHQSGVIHRDIKPGNIMITKSGVKLLDFGLAAAPADTDALDGSTAATRERLTEAGQIVGTLAYIAPELLRGSPADARSDVFSLGLVLYEMLTGRKAFDASDRASLVAAILDREPSPLIDLAPGSPPALDRLVRACLAKDPEVRIQSAHDVKLQLQWILDGLSDTALLKPRKRTRSTAALLLIVLGVATLAAAAGLLLFRSRRLATRVVTLENGPLLRTSIDLRGAPPLGVGTFVPAVGFFSPLVAFSHDATQIVYVGALHEETQLYRRRLGFFGVEPIAGTEGAHHAVFSPDDRWIAFLSGNQVMKVAAAGGAPVKLADVETPTRAVWRQPDAIHVIDDQGREITWVPAAGGATKKLGSPGSRYSDVLPDGRYALARSVARVAGDFTNISVMDLQTQAVTTLPERGFDARFVPPDQLIFARGGDLFAVRFDVNERTITGEPILIQSGVSMESFWGTAQYAISSSGALAFIPGSDASVGRLAWIEEKGQTIVLDMPSRLYGVMSLSPDDRRVALEVADMTDSIGIYDFGRGEMRRLALNAGTRLPDWTSDSRLIFTLLNPNENGGRIAMTDARGQGLQILYGRGEESVLSVASSADGRTLVAALRSGPATGNYVVSVERPADAQRLIGGGTAAISPDGKWVAYSSQRSGKLDVWVSPLLNLSDAYQVSLDGGIEPRWCRRCPELFYRKGTQWYSVDTRGGHPDQWPAPRPRWLTEFVDTRGRSYDVSSDGKRLLVSKRSGPVINDRIELIQNWPRATVR